MATPPNLEDSNLSPGESDEKNSGNPNASPRGSGDNEVHKYEISIF